MARVLKQTQASKAAKDREMTRISRIKAPRATVLVFALLAAAMLAFGAFAKVSHEEPPAIVEVPNENPRQGNAWLQLCWF